MPYAIAKPSLFRQAPRHAFWGDRTRVFGAAEEFCFCILRTLGHPCEYTEKAVLDQGNLGRFVSSSCIIFYTQDENMWGGYDQNIKSADLFPKGNEYKRQSYHYSHCEPEGRGNLVFVQDCLVAPLLAMTLILFVFAHKGGRMWFGAQPKFPIRQ